MKLSFALSALFFAFAAATPAQERAAQSHPASQPVKISIASLPLRSPKVNFNFDGYTAPASELNRMLSQKLNNLLSKSARYRVLDREYLVNIMGEQDLIRSSDSSPAEQQKLGKRLGADYLIVGSLEDAGSTSSTRTVELTGQKITNRECYFSVDYRILHVESSAIAHSGSIRIRMGNDDLAALGQRFGGTRIDEMLCELATEKLAAEAMDAIFPVRVARVAESDIYLNEGAARLATGDILNIYIVGPDITDPESGLKLGSVEKRIASVRVVRVEEKFSVAQIVTGAADSIAAGSICRKK